MRTIRFGAAVIAAALFGMVAIALKAQVNAPAPAATPVPLAKAIVGTWSGDSFYDNSPTNFGRTTLELRFTEHGIVMARRGPLKNRPVVDSWVGDYIVVGSAVYISPHGGNDDRCILYSLAIVDDRLAGLVGATGNFSLGVAFSVRRQ